MPIGFGRPISANLSDDGSLISLTERYDDLRFGELCGRRAVFFMAICLVQIKSDYPISLF